MDMANIPGHRLVTMTFFSYLSEFLWNSLFA